MGFWYNIEYMNLKIIKIICAVLLLLALFNFPIGYYQILRWTVMIISAYLSYNYFNTNNKKYGWIFAAIAILFNPLIPFYLDKSIWQIFDLVVSGVFLISIKK